MSIVTLTPSKSNESTSPAAAARDIIFDIDPRAKLDIAHRPLPLTRRLYNNAGLRRLAVILMLAAAWQGYSVYLDNPFVFPRLDDTLSAFARQIMAGVIPQRAAASLGMLLTGYAVGLLGAALIVGLAVTSKIGASVLETLTAMLNPLPSIALLPMAMLWFGLGPASLVFVLIHAVMWVVAVNTYSGFLAVPQSLRKVGRNYGLGFFPYIARILIPAAFPGILAGLKIGWAFAWRTLVAAELVFGAASGNGGLGWYVFENKNELRIDNVFAGLLAVIAIGLIVDSLVFRVVENRTVRRWGMQAP